MKPVNIGLIGLGTVGKGIVKILTGTNPTLRKKVDHTPVLKAIADRSIKSKANEMNLDNFYLSL